ncbi:MAG: MarR family winged helix-turn-helix transcriptional regulator [Minwuia sp.]|uniref:MarR family winged helix-turn-helix transcriptional regulator n=1 Tax=Minwuia sp. TaxID=2493630 RepID=UPI003A8594ED
MENDGDFDLTDFLPYLLNQAAEEASLAFQQVYRERYGMLRTEWRVLFHLGRYGPMTAAEIGARARIHKTKISRAVAALESRRFLTRARLEADRRQEELRLTVAGQRAFEDLRGLASAHNDRLRAGFSERDWQGLTRSLRHLARMDR